MNMDKLKVFISIPMKGKNSTEIKKEIEKEKENIRKFIATHGYKGKKEYNLEFLSGFVKLHEDSDIRNMSLCYLGVSLQKLAAADVIWLGECGEDARGCVMEATAARLYGTPFLQDISLPDLEKFLENKEEYK